MKDYLPLYDDDFEYEDALFANDGAVLLDCPNIETALAYQHRFHDDCDVTIRTEVDPVVDDDHPEPVGARLTVEYLQFDDEHGWFGTDRPVEPNERSSIDVTDM